MKKGIPMTEDIARESVIGAAAELVREGLIVRTWGNISCRVDDRTFVITPSGKAYGDLTPESLVRCAVADGSWTGEIKPSSERGLHAMVYRMRPGINFVVHTHQPVASVLSAAGLVTVPAMGRPLLRNGAPVAAYALPGTKKLQKTVERELGRAGHAVIMARHGALCFGADEAEAFAAARQLEQACEDFLREQYLLVSGAAAYDASAYDQFYSQSIIHSPLRLFNSRRTKNGFVLKTPDGKTVSITSQPAAAAIHRAIYRRRGDIKVIRQATGPGALAVSLRGDLMPVLDDFAQLIGAARLARKQGPTAVADALGRDYGVLVPGAGALCCAATADDAYAAELVMEKNAQAVVGASLFGDPQPIPPLEARLMQLVYRLSYAKKK